MVEKRGQEASLHERRLQINSEAPEPSTLAIVASSAGHGKGISRHTFSAYHAPSMPFQLPLRILSTWLAVWLAGGVYASSELILGQWALANFTMSCPADGHSCAYRFQIVEGVDGTGGPTTECRFTIDSQGVPATLLNFTTQSCDGSDAYRVNGGWDPLGFITLCVSHASEDTWAFFGYESWQVVNAIAAWMNVRPAYKMFTFNETDERAVGERAEARGRQELIVGSRAMGTERERRRERVPDSPRSQSLSRQVSDNDYNLTWTIEEFQRGTCGGCQPISSLSSRRPPPPPTCLKTNLCNDRHSSARSQRHERGKGVIQDTRD